MIKSAFLAMSLDGYIAGHNHDLSWLEVVNSPGEDYGYQKFFDAVDALFIGRNTFEKVREFKDWPYNGKSVFVRTRRTDIPQEFPVTTLSGDLNHNLRQIEDAGANRVYMDGGQLVMEALRLGLLDDLTLSIIPIVLGGGVSLFTNNPQSIPLQLVNSKSYPSGLVQNTYKLG